MRLNFIKHLFGWSEFDYTSIQEPCVVVYAHTSYWDAFFYFLYRISSYGENFCVLVQPSISKWYFRPISLLLNMVFAPPNENKNSNSTKTITEIIRNMPSSKTSPKCFILSPKGTCSKREWRSGYYYIAKELNYKIYPICIDYTERKCFVGKPVNPNEMSLEECSSNLQKQLGQHRGLYIEQSEFEINDPNACPYECLLPFDLCMATTYTFIPYLISLINYQHYYRFGASLPLFFYCLFYHYKKEGAHLNQQTAKLFQEIEANYAKVMGISHVVENLYTFGYLPSTFYLTLLVGLFFYKNGTPRGFSNRGKYVIFHSIHHILISVSMYSLAIQNK